MGIATVSINQAKRANLINALLKRPQSQDDKLIHLEFAGAEIAQRPDWLWHLLLSSMSTMGNNRGYKGLILTDNNYNLVSYQTLPHLNSESKYINLCDGLYAAKVLYYKNKAKWLLQNFIFIEEAGGLSYLQTFILKIHGRDSKIKFMKVFDGIGDKYARNIFMDLCHKDFKESIAVDDRLKKIYSVLGIDFKLPYNKREELFIQIAHDTGITPWSLDRLLFNFTKYYIEHIT